MKYVLTVFLMLLCVGCSFNKETEIGVMIESITKESQSHFWSDDSVVYRVECDMGTVLLPVNHTGLFIPRVGEYCILVRVEQGHNSRTYFKLRE